MAKILGISFFFTIVLSLLFLLQFYLLNRLGSIYNLKFNRFYVVGLLMLNLILVNVAVRLYWNEFIHIWYTISMIYLGTIWILLLILPFYHLIQIFIPIPVRFSQYFILILSVTTIIYSIIAGFSIKQTNISISTDKIKDNIRIVQLSDIHIGGVYRERYLKRIVDKTNALNPDLVVITGDLFDGTGGANEETVKDLKRLNAPAYFITGNHEYYANLDNFLNLIKNNSVKILRNESTYFNNIQLVGVDDLEIITKERVDSIIKNISFDNNAFTIFLTHQPVKFDYLKEYPFDLELAGHTHAGQMFPIKNLFVWMFFPYNLGLYQEGNKSIYVSQGTGTWGPPMRLGTSNEITLIELKKK